MMVLPETFSFTKKGLRKAKYKSNFFAMPGHIKNVISLFLPIEDIIHLKSVMGDDNFLKCHRLLHKEDQKQLLFRFTRNMKQVFTRSQLSKMGIRNEDSYKICVDLSEMQAGAPKLRSRITNKISGMEASTRDEITQDVDRTLDGLSRTFWSSNGSANQEKVDWLLYDLGTIAVITRITIAAFKATFHIGTPVYGFKKCWIELGFDSDKFHYKTQEFMCMNTDEPQNFTSEHLDNLLPAARFIKFWMQGCHTKQSIDDLWYFAINDFQVEGIPLNCFPDPVPKIQEVDLNLKSQKTKWLEITKEYEAEYKYAIKMRMNSFK